jgi:hypothetical protein
VEVAVTVRGECNGRGVANGMKRATGMNEFDDVTLENGSFFDVRK